MVTTQTRLTYQADYLELPILIMGKFTIGKVKLLAGLGPYIGFALAGSSQHNISSNALDINTEIRRKTQTSFTRIINWEEFDEFDENGFPLQDALSDESWYLKRLDAGLTLSTGLQVGAFQMGILWTKGIRNISGYQKFKEQFNFPSFLRYSDNPKITNSAFSLSLAYIFGLNDYE
ncbi:MAG: hypothetical protein HC913_07525 [Microscillaceae bacterium]|nr:hypothetical protein [Microscillaceae bacterium]